MLTTAKSQQFFILANALGKTTVVPEIIASLDSLDDHLAYRTFLVGNDITAADFLVWGAIKGNSFVACVESTTHDVRRLNQDRGSFEKQQAPTP
jgi:glutathione S-transferase